MNSNIDNLIYIFEEKMDWKAVQDKKDPDIYDVFINKKYFTNVEADSISDAIQKAKKQYQKEKNVIGKKYSKEYRK